MPTIKIAEYVDGICRHIDHNPKAIDCQTAGIYRHKCPECRKEIEFTVTSNDVTQMSLNVAACLYGRIIN